MPTFVALATCIKHRDKQTPPLPEGLRGGPNLVAGVVQFIPSPYFPVPGPGGAEKQVKNVQERGGAQGGDAARSVPSAGHQTVSVQSRLPNMPNQLL